MGILRPSMRQFAVLSTLSVFFLFSGAGSRAQEAPTIVEILSVADRSVAWRPDWPADLPPDAFALRGAKQALSITLSVEAPETSSETASEKPSAAVYSARWTASGALRQRPYFSSAAAYALTFKRDGADRPIEYLMEAIASTGAADLASESVSLSYGPDGSLSGAERKNKGTSEKSVFTAAADVLEELSYDEDGKAIRRISYSFIPSGLAAARFYEEDGKETTLFRFDYDSGGRVTRVRTADATVDSLYDAAGHPLFARSAAERRYQWDERGLLVRESVAAADGKIAETVYAYSFDTFGEWTERRSFAYVERFGIRTPEKGGRVLRKIIYRER